MKSYILFLNIIVLIALYLYIIFKKIIISKNKILAFFLCFRYNDKYSLLNVYKRCVEKSLNKLFLKMILRILITDRGHGFMKIAICDGSHTELKKYKEVFSDFSKKHAINAVFTLYSSGEALLFHSEEKSFADIIFLEVNLPDISGIELAHKLRESGFTGEIIFLSISEKTNDIISGYDVDAFHYISKFHTPMDKVEEIFLRATREADLNGKKYFAVCAGNELFNVPISSIRYFETYRRIFTLYYDEGKFEFHTSNFNNIQKQLEGYDFVRTHRSYLVALKEIKTLTMKSLVTRYGESLPVGPTYYSDVKKALTDFEQIHAKL